MFDLGFEPQVMRIVENCRPDRQTLMFSATFPRQMELLARKALTNPIEVQVGGRSVVCSDVEQHAVSLFHFLTLPTCLLIVLLPVAVQSVFVILPWSG